MEWYERKTQQETILMDVVRIDRSTIRRNPNAGMTATCIPGVTISSFEYHGENLPDILKNAFVAYSENNYCCGELERPLTTFELDELQKAITQEFEELIIHEKTPSRMFYHPPEPKWLFDYEDTAILCGSCGGTVMISETEIDDDYDGGDASRQCPLCKKLDTFNFTHEDIEDVIDK